MEGHALGVYGVYAVRLPPGPRGNGGVVGVRAPASAEARRVAARALGAAELPAGLGLRSGGRRVAPGATLRGAGVPPLGTLEVVVLGALRGGGGDGGSTGAESRSCFLEMYKQDRPGALDPKEERRARWSCCALTGDTLETAAGAVVADELGRLYNKEPVLTALKQKALEGVPMPPRVAHVRGLKDLCTLRISRAEEGGGGGAAATPAGETTVGAYADTARSPFCCPLTALEFNGRFRFVALWPSGVVVSERALKQVPSAVEEMLGEGAKLSAQRVMPLNSEDAAEQQRLHAEMEARHATKKSKKAAAAAAAGGAATGAVASAAAAGGDGLKRKAVVTGADDVAAEAARRAAKKYNAGEHAPAGATKEVWASLFTSSTVDDRKETYTARCLSFQR